MHAPHTLPQPTLASLVGHRVHVLLDAEPMPRSIIRDVVLARSYGDAYEAGIDQVKVLFSEENVVRIVRRSIYLRGNGRTGA